MSINIQKAKSMPIQQTRLIKPVNRSMPIKLKSKSKSKINELIKHMTIQDEQQTELESIKQFIENVKDYYIFEINNTYFIKSCLFFYYLKAITTYILINKGRLNRTSANCSFIISNINEINYFIKFVNYNTIFIKIIDLPIIDNINGYIFTNIINRLDHTQTYKYSFLSYCKDNKWDYKELYDDINYKKNINIYKSNDEIKNYVCMYLAINGKCLDDIFNDNEDETIEKILNNYCNFIDFLIKIGFDDGFTHNDMHFSNIMFDYTTNTIKIIDYGRVIFFKYIDNDDTTLNDFCKTEVYKLNFDNDLNKLIRFRRNGQLLNGEIKTYKELFKKDYNLVNEYSMYIQEDFNIKSIGYLKYPYILFDLITFYFNMYIKLYLYLKRTNKTAFDDFKNNFEKIIKINTDEDEKIKLFDFEYSILPEYYEDCNSLFKKYDDIYKDYILLFEDEKIRKQYKYLLDGLILIVLIIIFKNKNIKKINFNNNALSNVIRQYFQVYYPMNRKIEFLIWLKTLLEANNDIIKKNEHHIFINLISYTGGKSEIKPLIKQEIKQEIKPLIKQEIKPLIKQEIKQEIKPLIKQEIKQEIKPLIKQEIKQEIKPLIKQEINQKIKPLIKQEIKQEIKPAKSELELLKEIEQNYISMYKNKEKRDLSL